MKKSLCIATSILLVMIQMAAHAAKATESLKAGFHSTPPEARSRVFWWWANGNVTQAAITRDLEEMKAKGIGGALIFDAGGAGAGSAGPIPAGPRFGSQEWVALFRHALADAKRNGIEISLNIQSGWNLGGPDVTPEEATNGTVSRGDIWVNQYVTSK